VSARSLEDRHRIQRLIETSYTSVLMPDRVFDRAKHRDFEPVARATGQETLWLAPPGSID
jgi:hypothetical protein